MLSPYRVIDVSNEHGLLCGQILADLGADVIQVEPLGGSSARRVGPFRGDGRDPEESLYWWAYTRNKRGIAIDFECDAGRDELRALAAGADFFIESEKPGRLASLGLGYDDLAAANPGLVYVSISPFGQTGPKASWAASDLTLMAAGGHAFLSGEHDGMPLRVSVPQAHAHASTDAAVGALIAHSERRRSGRGQHVDVSTQQSVTLATMFRCLDTPLEQVPAVRNSSGVQVGAAFIPTRYRLADGWVVLGPSFLPSTGHFMNRLMKWLADLGIAGPELVNEDWSTFALRLITGQLGADAFEPAERALRSFFEKRTKAELMQEVVDRKLLISPMLELDEIIDSAHMADREFPVELARDGATARYPGPLARFSETPIRYRVPPPRLDEHGAEIRGEGPRSPAATETRESGAPLEGVKILDLFWILAGPGSTRMLADYGATVVKVESRTKVDTLRVIPPYQFSHPDPEFAGAFQCANANKLGITLDLGSAEGREMILELVRWADVVTESFAPGVIDHYDLGYETLRSVKPDLIMISSCLMGQSGPWRDFAGFGNLAASVTGFQQLAGHPGAPPSGPFGAYTDFISVRYNAAAILAALDHRERTGQGQYIDESQAEAALHFLAPGFLDYTVNGRAPKPDGNRDREMSPHGIFPTTGEERWIAIAVSDDDQWRRMCDWMQRPDLVGRRSEVQEIEAAIAAFTRDREGAQVERELQELGIAAHVVLDTPGLFEDEQLQHRGHFIEIAHEVFEKTTVESSRLRLSRSEARTPERALQFGRDNREVLEGILGYAPERIADLAARGILL